MKNTFPSLLNATVCVALCIAACAGASLVFAADAKSATTAAAAARGDRPAAVTFEFTPAKIDIGSARTAVLVVDMQNDFCSRGGLLDLMGWDLSGVQRTIAPTARVLTAARKAGLSIVYLKGALKPDPSDPAREGLANLLKTIRAPDDAKSRVQVRDTWNTDIVPALKPEAGDSVIYKYRYSGFFETELHATLRKMGVTQLVVVGATTSVCVESTIRDASFRDYACVLLADCTAEPMGDGRTNYEASLRVIQARFGAISDSETFVKAVESRVASAR
jgi:ureidoacrylate peracid hydrolase